MSEMLFVIQKKGRPSLAFMVFLMVQKLMAASSERPFGDLEKHEQHLIENAFFFVQQIFPRGSDTYMLRNSQSSPHSATIVVRRSSIHNCPCSTFQVVSIKSYCPGCTHGHFLARHANPCLQCILTHFIPASRQGLHRPLKSQSVLES